METVLIIFLVTVLIVALVTDVRFGIIPNYLTGSVMLVGLTYHGITGGLNGFLFGALGLVVGIGLFFLPYIMGGMGAGDAKLMGAVGAILGAKEVFAAGVYTAILGGLYAVILILIKRKECGEFFERYAMMLKLFVRTQQFCFIPAEKGEKTPRLFYGVAIACGTL
ncbi:MAG: A24 family peptidase, partial [Planctomycetota bacterium]